MTEHSQIEILINLPDVVLKPSHRSHSQGKCMKCALKAEILGCLKQFLKLVYVLHWAFIARLCLNTALH